MVVMTERRVLTDEMWERLEPLLPDRTPRRGGQWTDHREVECASLKWPQLEP